MKSNQDMNIDIFFGSIVNGQLQVLKDYFNLDVYNFETFLYYYLDRVTDINVMIDNTINTNFKEFLDTICQLPISSIFYHSQDNEIFGFAPYSLKLNLGCLSETIIVKDYHLSEFKIFKRYEDLIWPLIIGQHHWLNNSADLMTLLSYLLIKINPESDLYDQYLSFITDMYRENPNESSETTDKTSLLKNIIINSEKKTFMYLSDINPNNVICLANKLNVNKYKFYSFLHYRFHNSNPFLNFKKMFQSYSKQNFIDKTIFNKYNYPLSSEECRRFFENNTTNNLSNVDPQISQASVSNHGYIEPNTRQTYQPYNTKLSKSDNSIDLIQESNKLLYSITESNTNKSSSSSSEKPLKSKNYNKSIKTYLNNKKYRNINVYEFKEIFKESSEWKEILITINNNKINTISKGKKNSSNNNVDKVNYSMLDLFSLIYDI
eukprot:jgi/Orpsp1_1/1176199/evm.model.c7180000056739.1